MATERNDAWWMQEVCFGDEKIRRADLYHRLANTVTMSQEDAIATLDAAPAFDGWTLDVTFADDDPYEREVGPRGGQRWRTKGSTKWSYGSPPAGRKKSEPKGPAKAETKPAEIKHTPKHEFGTAALTSIGHHAGQKLMPAKDVVQHLAKHGIDAKTPWFGSDHAKVAAGAKDVVEKLKAAGYKHMGHQDNHDGSSMKRREILRGNGHDVTVQHSPGDGGAAKVYVSKEGKRNPSVAERMRGRFDYDDAPVPK